MPVQFRGRHTRTDIFKPGERCHLTGSYVCESCRLDSRSTLAQVEDQAIFPLCTDCIDMDMGWRLRQEST